MLTGDKDARTYVEPDTFRRGYSVRPAYRKDPTPGVPSRHDERVTALWALLGALAIIAAFVAAHLVMPHIAFAVVPPVCLPLTCLVVPWASIYGVSQAIPPAYTRFIGEKMLAESQKESA